MHALNLYYVCFNYLPPAMQNLSTEILRQAQILFSIAKHADKSSNPVAMPYDWARPPLQNSRKYEDEATK